MRKIMLPGIMLPGILLLLAACGGGDGGTGPAVTTTVLVTSTPTQISVNGTAQASAVVKDQNGNALTGKTIEWTSLNPSVATVNSSGLITGVAPGSATIQGKVDGVTGTAGIIVIAPVSVCNTGLTIVDLPVGGVRVLSSSETKGCIKVPAASGAPADYLVIPANINSLPDDVGNYNFKSDEGETVPGSSVGTAGMLGDVMAVSPAPVNGLGAAQIGFETRLRLTERRELSLPAANRAFHNRQGTRDQRYSVSTAIPVIGEQTNFKIPRTTNSCNNFATITAAVQYINDKVIIYTDITAPTGGFDATQYQQIGDEFSSLIYPTDVSYFGTPLDLDANSRVIILYTPEVNRLTPAGNSSFVGGFFWAGDLFPSTGSNSCQQSNMAEILYLLAPDPEGTINGNKRSTAAVRQGTRGTIAHEFQHMINASERIRSPIEQSFEDVWLDEALAHFAEDANGRVVRGIGEDEDANFSRTLAMNVDDFNAFFFQNFGRFRLYLQNPGPWGPTSSLADSSLATRGAAWALLRYAADQYAPGGDVKAFTRKLAGGPDIGVTNLTKNAGGVSFDALISGWMVANYADNLGIPGLSSLNSYKVYNMRSIEQSLPASNGVYPLVVNDVAGPTFGLAGLTARSGSGNYFFAQRNAGSPARTFRFLNPDGTTAASFSGAAWIVVRTR